MQNVLKSASSDTTSEASTPLKDYVQEKYVVSSPVVKTSKKERAAATDDTTTESTPSRRKKFIGLMIVSCIAYSAIFILMWLVPPARIQNVLLPNSYAPLLGLSLLAHFCFFSFVFLHARRGLLMSFSLTTMLFFRLQGMFNPLTIFFSIAPFVLLELILTISAKQR